jgi:chitinase
VKRLTGINRADGVWDSNVTSIGSYAYAHTNLTEINSALELLWRNNINPQRVNLGLGFYGRSK